MHTVYKIFYFINNMLVPIYLKLCAFLKSTEPVPVAIIKLKWLQTILVANFKNKILCPIKNLLSYITSTTHKFVRSNIHQHYTIGWLDHRSSWQIKKFFTKHKKKSRISTENTTGGYNESDRWNVVCAAVGRNCTKLTFL